MEEEKTEEPELVLPPKRGPSKGRQLFIDTDSIQEQYDKEFNPTSVDEETEKEEVQKIRLLALRCLAAMRGVEVSEPLVREAPLSVREQRTFTFPGPQSLQPPPPMSTRNKDFKERKGKKTFADIMIVEESEQSASKKSSGAISIEQRTPKMSPSEKSHHENLVLLYTSLLEMVFQKSINKVSTPPSEILSTNCLYILLTWTLKAPFEIKELVMADLNTIVESPANLHILSQSEQVLKFLISMTQFALSTSNANILSDSHELIKRIAS